ncbi:MAG: L-seryl-tRNA(Sec) selenium transferase [Nitrospinae bacterium]|nr:L-seryl-tRNA(Sec) selenium transferase [Nitrospinota bacterium]
MNKDISEILRRLPSISDFLKTDVGSGLGKDFGEGALKLELRRLLEEIRSRVREQGTDSVSDLEELGSTLRERLERLTRPIGRRAINATGIILHTNLGRAPLCEEAVEAVSSLARYSVLEIGVESGKRSHRDEYIEPLIMELTGCEAAGIVNNNAAAVMIILNTLFKGREVLISRGQLVEIGGAFRMPDVMEGSGAIMREVGTTNRTHIRDYEDAFTENTGGIMHVHNSNYRIIGFAGAPDVKELCGLGKRRGIPVVDDSGGGALFPMSQFGLPDEPLVQDSIKAGADAVCFSGDKLIGGAQAGIICGKRETIERMRKNPFARMFRADKMALAALRATLVHIVNGDLARIPLYKMLARKVEELEDQAWKIASSLAGLKGVELSVDDGLAYVGSGAMPDEGVPSKVVRVRAANAGNPFSAEKKARRLRESLPAVFCRVQDNSLLFDMRTLQPEEPDYLAKVLREVLTPPGREKE